MCIIDLHNSDRGSTNFLRKISYARFALAQTDSIRSVSQSLLAKPPYRRAASVPIRLFAQDSGRLSACLSLMLYLCRAVY